MAIDPKTLNRLTGVLKHFDNPNEGEAIAAFHRFRAMCTNQRIDLREYELLKPQTQKPGPDPAEISNLYKKEVAEAKRQHAADNRKHAAEVQNLEAELRIANDLIKLLQKTTSHIDNRATAKIAALEAELAEARKTIAQLQKRRTDDSATSDRIAALETELASYRDPWLDIVRKWLDDNADRSRLHGAAILREAVGLDSSQIGKDDERRLGEIMRRIGGWSPSEHIGGRYNRGRGYIRIKPYLHEQLPA